MEDISIDCETLGNRFDAPVIAIGARVFDRRTGKLGKKLYTEVSIDSALKVSKPSASTIAWWIGKSPRAKALFERPDTEKPSLATALLELNHFIRDEVGLMKARPWGNGATADITWLEHAFAMGGHGLTLPWDFRKIRDMRTIVDLAEDLTDWEQSSVKEVGVSHKADDDATYQANVISSCYAALRGVGRAAVNKKLEVEDEL